LLEVHLKENIYRRILPKTVGLRLASRKRYGLNGVLFKQVHWFVPIVCAGWIAGGLLRKSSTG
jgi:hypothetical protein